MSALTKSCPHCGLTYPAEERFCPKDGTALRFETETPTLVGQVLAERYLVLQELGEGGMGKVYLGEHLRMKRKSAVKVMQKELSGDAAMVSRFNREAENASQIIHPNVAAIFDFGETPDGLLYLAMEYVDGEPLTKLLLRERALAPRRVARIVRQVADGLHAAHELGIVHRDLKPDNVMLARRKDGSDWAKIVDFGIAKAVNAGAGRTLTKTGYSLGTPEYMSPEQLAGDAVDARTDVYALGLIAFNMLTGDLPFPGGSSRESLILRLTSRPRTLAETAPQVSWPADVQRALGRALEADPAARYGTATDFAADLERAVDAWGQAADAPLVAATAPTQAVHSSAITGAAAAAATASSAPLATQGYSPSRTAEPAIVIEPMTGGGGTRRLVAAAAVVVALAGAGYLFGVRNRDAAPVTTVGAPPVGGTNAGGAPATPGAGSAGASGTKSASRSDRAAGSGGTGGSGTRSTRGSGQAKSPNASTPATRPAPRDSAPTPAAPAPATPTPPPARTDTGAAAPRSASDLDSLVRATVESGKVDRAALAELLRVMAARRDQSRRPQEQARLAYNMTVIRALMGDKATACPQLQAMGRMTPNAARRAEARQTFAKICTPR